MCGIAAIAANGLEIPDNVIESMTERLTHRGPDDYGYKKLPGCQLGHRRLSVIDLATGDQPMTEETHRYWIIFNGEIYNYRELRHDLEQRGWQFRTQSDTEVLLRAYQEYGRDVPARLNGQFAFAIWDHTEQCLFAARDRLGEKPLYWATSEPGHFLLASELKSILAAGLIEPRIDPIAVDAYLALLYVPPNQTIYQNIYTLRPGHALLWQQGQWQQWSYWQPGYSHQKPVSIEDTVAQLRFLIAQAVNRQMVADVPVGAFLSGGLDSSTIVALMTGHTSQPVMTFSVGFGDLIDELPYARAVAQTYKTDHHEIQMDIPLVDMLERMAEVYDEPFADSSNIPTYLMSGFVQQYVKVALSGDGGDELFGGYEWYSWLLADSTTPTGRWPAAWLKANSLAWRAAVKAGLPFQTQRDRTVSANRLVQAKRRHPDFWERHLALTTGIKATRSDLGNGWDHRLTEMSLRQVYLPDSNVKNMDRAIDFDIQCYLPGDILVKVDRAAMAHGLETRAPFLDVDLVEFVLGLPWQMRFQNGTLKYLLRRACADLWPETLLRRSKQGFGAPIWRWVQEPDVQQLVKRVCAPNSPLSALLPGAQAALPRLQPQAVWTILSLGLWLERRTECLKHLP